MKHCVAFKGHFQTKRSIRGSMQTIFQEVSVASWGTPALGRLAGWPTVLLEVMRPLVCPLWSESWIISHVAQPFPASAFTLTSSSGGWKGESEKLPPCAGNVLPLSIHRATHRPQAGCSPDTHTHKKRFALKVEKIRLIWFEIFFVFVFRFCSLICARSSSTSSNSFILPSYVVTLLTGQTQELINGLLSAPRHTCWVADLCFNVSFVWRLVFQHPQLE